MGANERVLIVEDELHALAGLAELVSGWGYRTETARDGIEGLEKVSEWIPGIIVTDLKMPRMDGLELLTRLSEMQLNAAVIVLTAQGSIERAVEAMRGFRGADGGGVGGVQDLERRRARRGTHDLGQDLGRQGRAAHAEEEDAREPLAPNLRREGGDLRDLVLEPRRGAEPSETVLDNLPVGGVVLPERGVFAVKAAHRVLADQPVEDLAVRRLDRARELNGAGGFAHTR